MIPPEIEEEILQNLPIKSVIRFKNVIKAWNSLITDRKFRKRYNSKASSQRILLSSPSGSRSFNYEKGSIKQLNFPHVKIVGSSNGLVCAALDKCRDFIVWNPTTGDYRTLPDPKISGCYCFTYGFGYDSSSDDYKTVVATNCIYKSRMVIKVFSLRKNSWKRIEDCIDSDPPIFIKPTVVDDRVAVSCNEALHWEIMISHLGLQYYSIIAFNLGKEKAIAIKRPFNPPSLCMGIGNIDGCLSISFLIHNCIELWVMKEYGELNSWQKLISIPTVFPLNNWMVANRFRYGLLPLCKISIGEVLLLRDRKELIKVCCKDNTIYKLEAGIKDEEAGLSQAIVYVESLESPFDYT